MPKIREVLEKYNKIVSFPLTPKKIRAAAYNPREFLQNICVEIIRCDDAGSPAAQKLIDSMLPLLDSL